ncbi:Uncharacterised protein [Chromobacterium violaceum]|uniref:Uncharacterized protein n=1 Tax=Chromobacterium violaceum TaxID=536 RepID=A0A3S4HH67_CHRVL|nr:Uncharacterised protein [Chromobacterium violaceum]
MKKWAGKRRRASSSMPAVTATAGSGVNSQFNPSAAQSAYPAAANASCAKASASKASHGPIISVSSAAPSRWKDSPGCSPPRSSHSARSSTQAPIQAFSAAGSSVRHRTRSAAKASKAAASAHPSHSAQPGNNDADKSMTLKLRSQGAPA